MLLAGKTVIVTGVGPGMGRQLALIAASEGAQVAIAVSGIAGPGGGTPGKPVGTVWFAWAWKHGRSVRTQTRMKVFKGDRDAIRRKAVTNALEGVLEL